MEGLARWRGKPAPRAGGERCSRLTAAGDEFRTASLGEPGLRSLPIGGLPAAGRDERFAEVLAGRSRKPTGGLEHHRGVAEALRCSLDTGRQLAVANWSVGIWAESVPVRGYHQTGGRSPTVWQLVSADYSFGYSDERSFSIGMFRREESAVCCFTAC
jgi:hypothetical protein